MLAFEASMETENGDFESKMEEYEAIEQIGRGAFGPAFLVLHKKENKKCVLKKIHLSKQTEKFKRTAYQEMNLIAKLRHPYILEYKDAWVDKGSSICIVTNYCERGNIYEIIKKARRAYFSEEKICKWLTQLLLAIDYLHSNRVLHRDLKLSNIFITKENDMCLGDFGLAKLLNEEGLTSSVVGTPNYMCPELLENIPYGYKSDIWSLGCCMFEIAAQQQAFRAPDMAGVINKINRSLISPLPIVYSSTLKQIIKSMLRKSPEHRPTAAELLRHPHLQPFLLRCHNPSAAFLPVKSPSPSNTKEKTRKPSPGSSSGGKENRERESKVKQRDLLPLFEESSNMQHPNLLDDDVLIEYQLVTKRVDPTSYSGNISHDSEDSKSVNTSETTACNGDDQDNSDSSLLKESVEAMDALTLPSNAVTEEQEEDLPKNTTKVNDNSKVSEMTKDMELLCSPQATEETNIKGEDTTLQGCNHMTAPDSVCSDNAVPLFDEDIQLLKDMLKCFVNEEQRSSMSVEENTGAYSAVPSDGLQTEDTENCPNKGTLNIKEECSSEPTQTEKEDSQVMSQAPSGDPLSKTQATTGSDKAQGQQEPPRQQRADALESLLELCARLLKQDKFDELSGILKPFSEDAVSSRETAIWLTKTLMNAEKVAKES